MKLVSEKNFLEPEIGSTVRVAIPQVDLAKTDLRNVLARTISLQNRYQRERWNPKAVVSEVIISA